MFLFIFFFKQKTAYEMRISDWSSDVCSSDLPFPHPGRAPNLSSDHQTNGGCRQRNRASHFPSVRRPCPALRRRSWAPSCWVSPECKYPVPAVARDRQSVVKGKIVSDSVDLGVCRIIKTN